ncbi:MAG: membrane protein insertase YidC [Coraliomargaritaceae bacterium]
MDKKNTILGILFLAAGMGFMFWQSKEAAEYERQRALEEARTAEEGQGTTPDVESWSHAPVVEEKAETTPMLDLLVQEADVSEKTSEESLVVAPVHAEQTFVLANDFIEVEFTSLGGAIQQVSFLQTKRSERDDYVFNQEGSRPALSLGLDVEGTVREFNFNYRVESKTDRSVTFVLDAGDGLVLRRSYALANGDPEQDPYIIEHSTTVDNRSDSAKAFSTVFLNLGTMRPLIENALPSYLNAGYFDGAKARFTAINKLTGGNGFMGIGASAPRDRIDINAPIQWTSVKNQFFASVLTSTEQAKQLLIEPVDPPVSGSGPIRPGITGSVGYDLGIVPSGGSSRLDFSFFVGPKEFKRLQALGNQQDQIMQYPPVFGFFSKLLLTFMYGIHGLVPSWGMSIILMTICIKLLFWPLTAQASRSQKRMAKIQEPMSELKEKYKDNPQKMQQETIKLFREHRINPVAGCLPILIQMPIFLGLFYMLRTASELRYEPFLWVKDLSLPDTVFELAGFPVNILPLIMGITMFLQMHMMPVSPTADPVQQKIFKFMPLIFLVFLYNFSSGLVLYWTVQNLLTIIQQRITNAMPDEPATAPVAATAVKNKHGGRARAKASKKK